MGYQLLSTTGLLNRLLPQEIVEQASAPSISEFVDSDPEDFPPLDALTPNVTAVLEEFADILESEFTTFFESMQNESLHVW